MPYPELVHLLRPALRELWTRGTEMEADWTAATLGRRGSHTGDSRSASDNEWSRSRPSFKSSSRNYASPTTTASASTPAHNSSSRQTYPRSESGLARTTTRDTPFGLRKETGRQAEPSSDQKPRKPHKISVSPELLLAEPNFDPFPTVHVAPPESAGGTTKSVSRTGVPNLPLHVDPQDILPKSLPPEPDFDPFPSVPAASLPAIATSRDIPTPLPASPPKSHTATSAKTTKPKGPNDTNWWAIGRKIEAAIGQDVEGPTRWDRATDTPSPAQPHAVGQQTLSSSAPKKQEAGESVQSRLSGMLYQQAEVARPDTHERAARRIPRQTHRFEVK
ncbi:hypothetical protein B0H19DRAFT_397747 [Mycena capillaripes]|nr:hypothetical protein B0H19DRAFT_397747 [Mycena capillaripes]